MAKYLLILSDDESRLAQATPEDFAQMMTAHQNWAQAVVDGGGRVEAGEALQPSPTARFFRGGTVTDAPLAETKELVNGFYLVEAASDDAAAEFARTCPVGLVELRPVMDLTAPVT